MPKIKRLEIKGFRAFGSQPQVLEFHGPMAVVWGPNGKGKTSLAEAIEFLLTGKTIRRELLASAKREFADALRHAHLPRCEDVVVIADIEDAEGRVHRVQRRLVRDYTGRDPCQSELTIGGNQASDLTTIGIRLSRPPLEAPVLMPHTLRYVVSAEPQERTEYFKAVLEVSDLEQIRNAISDAKNQLPAPTSLAATIYERCRSNARFGDTLAGLDTAPPSRQTVERTLTEALERIVAGTESAPDGLDARLAAVKTLLDQRRTQIFPINALEVCGEQSWDPQPDLRQPLGDFVQAKSAIDAEFSRLVRLFEEVLKVPEVALATEPVNCPVCETPKALTPDRIAIIRERLETNAEFKKHHERAERLLTDLDVLAKKMVREAERKCPSLLMWQDEERSQNETALATLLGDTAAALLTPWRNAVSNLNEALRGLKANGEDLQNVVSRTRLDDLDHTTVEELEGKLRSLFSCGSQFGDALRGYREAAEPLIAALKRDVDRQAGTEGWQDLIDVTQQKEELLRWLIERHAYQELLSEVEEAIRQIDDAKAQILDEKFSELGQDILRWWNLLRPDEPTSFHSLERGGTGRRFLDFKARLAAPGTTSSGAIRDAVAVFSDSQLNCLGLAAFLARTVREGAGFVVLDDPVPASDEEHRAFFIDRVLQKLANSSTQVILLTHDERMWKDVQERYLHLNLDTFVVTLEDPRAGATVENRSDTFDALLARASPYIENANPDIRKIGAQRLRDACERFCKLMLVRDRHGRGEPPANVSDYDGKNLGDLVPKVLPLLRKDPSHPGKLKVIGQRLNPGAHDDAIPPPGDLKQCLGDLRKLRKAYLP